MSGFGQFVSLLPHRGQAGADVPDRADQVFVVGSKLGTQPTDVDIHGARAAIVVIAPHLGEQLLAGEDAAGRLGEVFE